MKMPAIKTKIIKEVLTFVTLNIFYSASFENYKWLFFLDSSNPVEIIYFPGSFYEDINPVVFNFNIICF
jgi:hypothetical protein